MAIQEHAVTARTIADVPPLGWGMHRETTFIGALEAALAVTDRPGDYVTLMGATGLAFRTRWFQGPGPDDRWCPSSPVGEFPEECALASRAIGRPLPGDCRLGEAEPRMEAFIPQIVASIDAGLPVLAYDDSLNVALLIGYEDAGRTVLMSDYGGRGTPARKPVGALRPWIMFLGEPGELPSQREIFLAGLRQAARSFRRRHDPEETESRGYWMGETALAKWAEDLETVDTLTAGERGTLFFVSWWNFDVMADARLCAVGFLCKQAGVFTDAAREAIHRAAALYEQESVLFGTVAASQNAFLGPWSGKSLADWSPEVRQREREVLVRARNIEIAAIDEIEAALAACG